MKKTDKTIKPKGYFIDDGFMGWVGDRYMLFATEQDYYDYIEENESE